MISNIEWVNSEFASLGKAILVWESESWVLYYRDYPECRDYRMAHVSCKDGSRVRNYCEWCGESIPQVMKTIIFFMGLQCEQ
jgi:ssDNA-binding Zn-finger/Zn-ribbon topoisomerase 1